MSRDYIQLKDFMKMLVVKVKKLNENYLFLFRIPVLNVDEMLESLVRKKR